MKYIYVYEMSYYEISQEDVIFWCHEMTKLGKWVAKFGNQKKYMRNVTKSPITKFHK